MSEQCTRGIIFDLDGTLYVLRWMKLRMALSLLGSVGVLRKLTGARAVIRAGSYADRESLLVALYQELGRRAGIGAVRAEAWYHEKRPGSAGTRRSVDPASCCEYQAGGGFGLRPRGGSPEGSSNSDGLIR